jgi:hypothetical protein
MYFLPTIDRPIDSISYRTRSRFDSRISHRKSNYERSYIFTSFPNSLKQRFIAEISKDNYPSGVLKNAVHLIEKLPESFLSKLNSDSFYKSKYNTLIIDFENSSLCLTIDIGFKSFGFFIEKDNNVIVLHENLQTEQKEERSRSISVLNNAIINNII